MSPRTTIWDPRRLLPRQQDNHARRKRRDEHALQAVLGDDADEDGAHAKEYAKEYAVKEKMISVKNLMENMKLTVDQALNALGIQGDERKTIINQLQNRN